MPLEAGSVFVRLAGLFDRNQFDAWDRAVGSARTQARTPVDAKLGADKSGFERELTSARSQLGVWATTTADAKVGVDSSTADSKLAGLKAKVDALTAKPLNITARADVRAAMANLEALKTRADSIERNININTDADVAGTMAKLAAVRAEIAAVEKEAAAAAGVYGGAGALGGGGGGGGGAAAAAAAAGAGGRGDRGGLLSRVLWGKGAFGLAGLGSLGSLTGFGFEHALTVALGLAGSATAGAAGGGLLAAGSLGTTVAGTGSDVLISKAALTNAQAASKAYENLQTAVQTYGKGSTQAKTAQQQLNATMAQMPPIVAQASLALAKQQSALSDYFQTATAGAQVIADKIFGSWLSVAHAYVPLVAQAAQQNLTIVNQSLQPLFNWLKGPDGIGIFQNLEDNFQKNLPTAIHAFTQGFEFVARVINLASNYTGRLIHSLDSLFTRLNAAPNATINEWISKLVSDFRLWENLLKAVGRALTGLFSQDVGTARGIVQALTDMLNRAAQWERTVAGRQTLTTIFAVHKQQILELLQVIPLLVKAFEPIYATVGPALVTAFNAVAKVLLTLITLIEKIPGGIGTWAIGITLLLGKLGLLGKSLREIGILLGIVNAEQKAAGSGGFGGGVISNVLGRFRGGAAGAAEGAAATTAETAGGAAAGTAAGSGILGGLEGAGSSISSVLGMSGSGAASAVAGFGAEGAGAAILGAGAIAGGGLLVAGLGFGAYEGIKALSKLFTTNAPNRFKGDTTGEIRSQLQQYGAPALQFKGPGGPDAAQAAQLAQYRAAGGGRGDAVLAAQAPQLPAYFGGQTLEQALPDKAKQQLLLDWLHNMRDASHMNADQLKNMINEGDALAVLFPKLKDRIEQNVSSLKAMRQTMVETSDLMQNRWSGAIHGVGTSLGHITDIFDTNMRLIAHTVGLNTSEGRKLVAQNLNDMTKAITNSMNHGKITVAAGMAAMKKDLEQGVKSGAITAEREYRQLFSTLASLYSHGKITAQKYLNDVEGLTKSYSQRTIKNWIDQWSHGEDQMSNLLEQGWLTAKGYLRASQDSFANFTQDIVSQTGNKYQNLFDTLANLYHNHKINTQQFQSDLHKYFQQGNQQITQNIQNAADQQKAIWKQQAQNGNITWKQYWANVHKLNQTANQTAHQDITGWANQIYQGMLASGKVSLSGAGAIVKELNSLLKPLGATQLPAPTSAWVSHPAINPYTGAGTGAHAQGGRVLYDGGIIPGGNEFGYEDRMTLVDPRGRPVAAMAGDEGIITRHQMPWIDRAMEFARSAGAVPYGSLEELWGGITRPHGYETGGMLRKLATGGYVYPLPSSTVVGRTDMGIDANMPAGAPIGPIGNARITAINPGWYSGQPQMVWQLTSGPDSGRYVYLAEQIVPLASPGQNVRANQAVARYASSGTGIEMGWAANASGTTLAQATTGYTEGQVTPAGSAFRAFLTGLSHGMIVGGPASIGSPHVAGHGKMTEAVQAGLNKTAHAANAYLSKQYSKLSPLAGAGFSGAGGQYNRSMLEKLWVQAGGSPTMAHLMAAIALAESGGNPSITNPSGASGLWQIMMPGNAGYVPGGQANVFNPLDNAIAAVKILAAQGLGAWETYTNGAYRQYMKRGGLLQRFARGGPLGGTRRFNFKIPGFQGGGSSPGLYNATKPGPRSGIPTVHPVKVAPPFPEGILKRIPGLSDKSAPFANDDYAITQLEKRYGWQQSSAQLYDPNALTTQDLNILYGIKQSEWDVLWKEWTGLPHFLTEVQHALHGHAVPIEGQGGQFAGPPVGYHHRGGVTPAVDKLMHRINRDERSVYRLNRELYRSEKHVERDMKGKHPKVTKAANDAAGQLAAKLVKWFDAKHDALEKANDITDRIHHTNERLRHLRGHARRQTAEQVRDLQHAREHQMDLSEKASKELEPLWDTNEKHLKSMQHQGYAIAWQHELLRLRVGEKIRKLQEAIKELKRKLHREQQHQTDFTTAITDIRDRLYGGVAASGGTSVHDNLEGLGLDILGLESQGAKVPQQVVTRITDFLRDAGVRIPPGAFKGGVSPTAAAAWTDFLAFQADRASLFSQFGSNVVAAGANPFGSQAAVAAGTQYFGAASAGVPGAAQGGMLPGAMAPPPARGGDTNVNIEQHFGGPAPDPHTYSAGLRHELAAAV